MQRYDELKSHSETLGTFTKRSSKFGEDESQFFRTSMGEGYKRIRSSKSQFSTAKEIILDNEMLTYLNDRNSNVFLSIFIFKLPFSNFYTTKGESPPL